MLDKSPDGSFTESNENVRQAAAAAVKTIDRWRNFYSAFQTLFFGLSLGSVLVLIAIGLAITFGVMGVINMAHGELMMLGAYTTYVVQQAMPNHIGVVHPGGDSSSVLRRGTGRRADGARDHSISLRTDRWRPCSRPSASASSCSNRSGLLFRRSTGPC